MKYAIWNQCGFDGLDCSGETKVEKLVYSCFSSSLGHLIRPKYQSDARSYVKEEFEIESDRVCFGR